VIHNPIELPDPPEGEGSWKYALIGETLAESPEGKELIERMESQDIIVEVLIDGGNVLHTMVQVPREVQLRAFHPDERIRKP